MNECATRMRHVATDACVLASNNASAPAQRGPRRDAQPPHATPLAAVFFPAQLWKARYSFFRVREPHKFFFRKAPCPLANARAAGVA